MRKAPNPKIFAVMAVGMLIVGGGAIAFQSEKLSTEHHKVKDLQIQAKDEKSIQNDVEASKKKLEDCKTELKHLELGVPDFAYVPTFLEDLAKAGKENGIEVTGVRPLPKPPVAKDANTKPERKAYEELVIEVKGRGNYASVRKFITALNTFPKIVAAKTVTLTPQVSTDPKDITDKLDIVIELKAFVFATAGSDEKGGTTKNG